MRKRERESWRVEILYRPESIIILCFTIGERDRDKCRETNYRRTKEREIEYYFGR